MKKFLNSFRLALPIVAILFSGVFSSCSDDDKLSDLTGFLSFGFSEETLADYEFTIGSDNVITNQIGLPYGFDASSLTPVFTAAPLATVTMTGVEQISGSTAMDFTSDVIYSVVAEDGKNTINYTVRVNVATDLSAWTNLAPDAKFPDYTSVVAFAIDNKYFVMGGKKGPGYGGHTYGIHSSTDGAEFSEVNTNIFKEYGMGLGAATVKHGDKQLLMGGYTPSDYEVWNETGNGRGINVVWASTDGVTWEQITKTEKDVNDNDSLVNTYSVRTNAAVANMNGDLYLVGGYSVAYGAPQGALGDAWKSTDGGVSWTNLEADFGADFVARGNSQLIVYNNELYLIGGHTGYPYTYKNEIYKSTDGVSWTMVDMATPFDACSGHICYVYNDRFYLLGGNVPTGELDGTAEITAPSNATWVSDDAGVNWTKVTEGALPEGFAARAGHAFVKDGNTVHIFGGNGADADGTAKVFTDSWKGTLN